MHDASSSRAAVFVPKKIEHISFIGLTGEGRKVMTLDLSTVKMTDPLPRERVKLKPWPADSIKFSPSFQEIKPRDLDWDPRGKVVWPWDETFAAKDGQMGEMKILSLNDEQFRNGHRPRNKFLPVKLTELPVEDFKRASRKDSTASVTTGLLQAPTHEEFDPYVWVTSAGILLPVLGGLWTLKSRSGR